MNLPSTMVSVYLVMALATWTCLLQENSCSAETVAYGDSGGEVNDKSVEDEKKPRDQDDELITQLLDAPIGNPEEDSEVSRILQILEAAEQATSTTTSTTTTTTTTTTTPTPIVDSAGSTTTTESPFFKTERPPKHSQGVGKMEDLFEMIQYLDQTFKEAEQGLEPDPEEEETLHEHTNETSISQRRGDYHEPPIKSLLWSTAHAIWDVSRPVLSHTTVGRKISLVSDTLSLPLRTFGAVRHKIHDLTHYPNGYDRKHRSTGWGGWHNDHDHHHHHGWGWDSPVTFVKYEPDNSLFKSWLRYLFRIIKPAVIGKIRLKRQLIRIKLQFIRSIIRLVQSVKIQKVFSILRALTTKLQILKSPPNVVVLKEKGTVKGVAHHGWGWKEHNHGWPQQHHGWPEQHHGWPAPPPPKPSYGPPQYEPPSAVPTYSYKNIVYGPPAMTSYSNNYKSWSDPPSQSYGFPPEATTTEYPSRVAYNKDNTYTNYRASPAQWLSAPEMLAQASEDTEQSGSSSSSREIETPSYATFLKQFGINPTNLADNFPGVVVESSSKDAAGRNLRQSPVEKTSVKNSEDVPYISEPSSSSDEATAKVDKEDTSTTSAASRRFYSHG